nr:carbohydrate ABC transporter permease [Paenibacillus albiflavus]
MRYLSRGIVYLILVVWSFLVIYPLFWTLFGSLKDNKQFFLGKPWDLPKLPFVWENFSNVWTNYHMGGYFFNSIVVTICSSLLALILSSTTSYILARFRFMLSGTIYTLYIAAMMVPLIMGLIPLFFLLDTLQLGNSLTGLILVYAAYQLPFSIFVLVGFYKTLPREIQEASYIDGASHSGTFFRIMMPLAKPGMITITIMNFLNIWNEYIYGVVLINEPDKYTLPVGIAVMQAEMQYKTEWGPLFAALLISMIPVFIVYFMFQRQIAGGITAGAVK